jgi:phosphatidylserine synthase
MNPMNILQDQLRPNYSGRLIWYQYTWNKLVQSPVTLAVGYGPGMFSSFTAERNQTPIFMEIDEIRTTQNFALLPASSYISVSAEFGLLGLLVYLIFIWSAYRVVSRALKNLKSKYWQGIAFGTKAAILYFLIAGITQNTWETSFVAGVMWLLVGIVYSAYRNQSDTNQLQSLSHSAVAGA